MEQTDVHLINQLSLKENNIKEATYIVKKENRQVYTDRKSFKVYGEKRICDIIDVVRKRKVLGYLNHSTIIISIYLSRLFSIFIRRNPLKASSVFSVVVTNRRKPENIILQGGKRKRSYKFHA